MTQKEAEMMKFWNMDCDFPSHVLTNGKSVEKINGNHCPEAAENLSSIGDCLAESSAKNLDDAKKLNARERRKRYRARQRIKKELSRNVSSVNDGVTSPSTIGSQEISGKCCSVEFAGEALESAKTEDVMGKVVKHPNAAGECSAASSTKDLDGHAEGDINSEKKEMKSRKRRKQVTNHQGKKRKLSGDGALASAVDIQEISCEDAAPMDVSDQVPTSIYTKEQMVELVSVRDPQLLVKENESLPVKEFASIDKDKVIKTDMLEKSIEEKQFNKAELHVESGTLKIEHMSQDGPAISSELSDSSNDDDVSQFDMGNKWPVSAPIGVHTGNLNKKLLVPDMMTQEESEVMKSRDMDCDLPSHFLTNGKPDENVVGNHVPEVEEHLSSAVECLAASSTKNLCDRNEAKRIKLRERRKRNLANRRKKKELLRNLSSVNDGVSPSTLGMPENSDKACSLEVSDQVPTSAYTKELMGGVVSFNDPIVVVSENALPSVHESAVSDKEKEIKTEILEKSIEENSVLYDASLNDMSETCLRQFNKDKPDTESGTLKIEPTLQDAPVGVPPGNLKKKLLVLDVNGILTDIVSYCPKEYTPDTIISRKAAFKRPFYDDFLRFCFENFQVGVWSSRTGRNVKTAVDFLMVEELQSKLLFCWDQAHCTDTGFNTLENREKPMVLKELTKLWEKHDPSLPWEKGDYNESNTLLLDDSPYKALRNPPFTAIFPKPYCFKDAKVDNSLGPGGDLRVYLERLASADDVQKFVEANPFGQRAITSANASWNFYRKVIRDTSLPTKRSYDHRSAINDTALRRH